MTSYLIDINVWLAMTWDLHPHHASAVRWNRSASTAKLLFCRFTMLGFLRLLTNQSVMGDSVVTLGQAFEIYDRWAEDGRVELAAEPRGVDLHFRAAAAPFEAKLATKAIADCYLAGFADASGARVVTFDRGLAGTAKSRKVGVTLLHAA
jgi:toxin-antitoxin system PIN domain toxin